ncbi:MAG: GGIII-like transmembrane region-containing protein, partial [Promethearchaeota archaeon]
VYYDPQPGDLWELKIIGEVPSLSLDGSISSNISEWYDVDFDPSLDIKEDFEFNISGHDYYEVFGDESDPALNWRMLNRLFLLPYTVEDENGGQQNFADFYGASFDGVDGEMEVDTTGGDLRLDGYVSDGQYENHSISFNCSLGVTEDFVYEKKQYDTGVTIGKVNITLDESEFGPPSKPKIPVYYYVIGGGVLVLGVITVVFVRKVRKPTSQTAPGPRDLGPKTKPDPEPDPEPEPD